MVSVLLGQLMMQNGIGYVKNFFSFHKEYGHSDVPRKNTELYRWTKQQEENRERFDHCKLVGTKAEIERKRRLYTLTEIFL